jgi:hypothetical protein|tara:strand:+ start:4085 stop:4303 length:219 start_codon:yes stop_codon:yes gene_type:complete
VVEDHADGGVVKEELFITTAAPGELRDAELVSPSSTFGRAEITDDQRLRGANDEVALVVDVDGGDFYIIIIK